jgi:2-oxoisovalerate dehydrogenase E1 component
MADRDWQIKAFQFMAQVQQMAATYEANRSVCKYVHSTSRGHEAIQLATAFQLQPQDFVSPYYRDESMLLGLGFTPYELMLQLLAKGDDIFTAGREYYSHPNYRGNDKPTIIHQSSATGMQAIPTTGIAQGIRYWEKQDPTKLRRGAAGEMPVVICSLGDASITEGEVSEAFQFAALHQLPIIYLVQDNEWGISVSAAEARAMNAFEMAAGFKGLNRIQVDGSDFDASYDIMNYLVREVREHRKPWLVHAKVPLLGHHTSGVRKEFYRSDEDWNKHSAQDPYKKLRDTLLLQLNEDDLLTIEKNAASLVAEAFEKAKNAPEPAISEAHKHVFVSTSVTEEKGVREPASAAKIVMVDAALFAIRELMEAHPELVLYGQDVGQRLGGVFREAATLAERFGQNRVFNTAIQEAYIVGSTIGMNAAGVKPIVEVQFADYIYPALNQLVTEISKSCYLTAGRFPVSMILRVPIGAYGGGGPYHSGSIETTLLSIKGIKVVYPSNAADMKGLMKAAFYDGNPVVMLEHKGLYWSKVPGTEAAKTPEPDRDYILPLGKASIVKRADSELLQAGDTVLVITYGMGVHWALQASQQLPGHIEIVDLRTLHPLDEDLVFERVKAHGRCLVLTEEQQNNSFAEALAGRITQACFKWLDAAPEVLGAANVPAIPMNAQLEQEVLPNAQKLVNRVRKLLEQ